MSKAPYTFVPVVLPEGEKGLYDVTFHDGAGQKALTGEIQCTMTALTPLLVGHFRYDYSDAKNALAPSDWAPHPDKGVLEPLFINPENPSDKSSFKSRRIVISGTSIKGMLRHSIGAMFGAPMERVQEQYYSYRPNLAIETGGKFECREAIVDKYSDGESFLQVKVLQTASRSALFINQSVYQKITAKPCKFGDLLTNAGIYNMNLYQDRFRIKKTVGDNAPNAHNYNRSAKYRLVKYCSGIDGLGEAAKTGPQEKVKEDVAVLLPENALSVAAIKKISPAVFQQFIQTKQELTDEKYGHIARNKDLEPYEKNIGKAHLEEGQLIYVEINTETQKIVSFGTNFRYRWRYADSIKKMQGLSVKNGSKDRAILSKLDNEIVTQEAAKLSAVRSIFGYVDGGDGKDNNLNLDIGDKEDYARLAGRISVNMALEKTDKNDLDARFITRIGCTDKTRFNIPLKPLGQPKASAVEHYVQQNMADCMGATTTYGDLPGLDEEYKPSELNGRKFYRHQAKAKQSQAPYLAANQDEINSQHGTLARFISKPGSEFRFTLRFKDLQQWELGAILLALNPDLICRVKDCPSSMAQHIPTAERDGVLFAQKIGYGRPLGLGSITVNVDEIYSLDTTELQLTKLSPDEAIKKFLATIKERKLPVDQWLKVMRYAGTENEVVAYPTKTVEVRGQNETTIYHYHTDIRRKHAGQRRSMPAANLRKNYGELIKP